MIEAYLVDEVLELIEVKDSKTSTRVDSSEAWLVDVVVVVDDVDVDDDWMSSSVVSSRERVATVAVSLDVFPVFWK